MSSTTFKNRVEALLGKPVECSAATEHVCFRKNGISLVLAFDSSDRAETIFMLTDTGNSQLTKLIDELVPKDDRGKFLKTQINASKSCQNTYVEGYECLAIEYFAENCNDLNVASVKIKWK